MSEWDDFWKQAQIHQAQQAKQQQWAQQVFNTYGQSTSSGGLWLNTNDNTSSNYNFGWQPQHNYGTPVRFIGGPMHGKVKSVPLTQYCDIQVQEPMMAYHPDKGETYWHPATMETVKYELIYHKGEAMYIMYELWHAPRPAVGVWEDPGHNELHCVVITDKPGIVGFSITKTMHADLVAGGKVVDQFNKDLKEIGLHKVRDLILDAIESFDTLYSKEWKAGPVPDKWEEEEEQGDPVAVPAVA